jgi:hypothetical protein
MSAPTPQPNAKIEKTGSMSGAANCIFQSRR